ncbi:tetratricopeptide repeat-containing sensor histidine kinase [Compostibacter hankyongensis]
MLLICVLALAFLQAGAQLPLDQQKYADSLTRALGQAVSDSGKARICFLLSNYWAPEDTGKARRYLEEGRRLGRRYPYITALSYSAEGYLYYTTDLSRSQQAYKKADTLLSRFRTPEAYMARSNIWATYAAMLQRQDDDRGYIAVVLNKAIPMALLAGDSTLVGSQYVGLATALMNVDENAKAEEYLDKAIAILKNKAPSRLVAAYNRAGENYLILKKPDKAKQVLDAAKDILVPYPGSELYAGYYLIEGLYYHEQKQYRKAVSSFDQGIAKAGGHNKKYKIQELDFYKIKSLLALHSFQPAKKVVNELAADKELMSIDQNRVEIYDDLAEIYHGTGDLDSAYFWLGQSKRLNDSLYESRLTHDINALEAKYRNAENQKQIATLRVEKAEAALSAGNNRLFNWLLGGACLILLIIAAFALLFFRNHKKLSVQRELNYQQQLKEMEQQQQLTVTRAMLEGEERERERVARDLHDGLGGMLAGVKINLSGWASAHAEPDDIHLHRVIGQLDSSVGELRRIARNMMPETLLKFGLETALKDLCEFYMKDGLHIDFQPFHINGSIPLPVQINIYRIVQEILSNAIRHSGATNIVLQCSQSGQEFFITAEDNGRGFDTGVLAGRKGMGLDSVRNRVEYLKGKTEIISAPGEGTTINIELHVDAAT